MANSENQIQVGFGDQFKKITIEQSDGDLKPYSPDQKFNVIGKSIPRLDAKAKVTGAAKYAYDKNLPGMLYGKILRSPHANANIKSLDLQAAKSMPGVFATLDFTQSFRSGSVRYAGQGIAAVAAETEQQAVEALAKIKVQFEILPHCVTTQDSLAKNAPQVGRKDQKNVNPPRRRRSTGNEQKDAEAAIKKAQHQVQAEFATQVHTHAPLETHGMVCTFENGQLVAYASTQATFGVQRELSRSTGTDNVRVRCEFVGGGFGSKFSAGREGVACALLAKQAKRPVKLLLDRKEEQTDAGNRPDSIQKISMGVNNDGEILGYSATTWGTSGSGRGGAGAHNDVIYKLGKTSNQQYGVRTNCGGARAHRAPGWPQGVFALEGMMDIGAEKIGMDPIDFRKRNDFHPIRPTEYDICRKLSDWDNRRQKKAGTEGGVIKSGLGVGSCIWFAAGGRGAMVRVKIHKNGRVEVRNGAQDIGTGTLTIMAQVAAEELGLQVSQIEAFLGDTDDPRGPASGGSTTAPTVLPVTRGATHKAKLELLEAVAEAKGWQASELDLKQGYVVKAGQKKLSFKQACALMIEDQIDVIERRKSNFKGLTSTNAGVQIAEVEVDTETGNVRVTQVWAVADAGIIINPRTAESQVRGGIIQGISYALYERRIMDRPEGRMVNADLENYKILGSADCPDIKIQMLDVYMGKNNTHTMGLGEPPIVATAAAVANAVYNAIGARVTSLPITPKKVLAALAQKEARK